MSDRGTDSDGVGTDPGRGGDRGTDSADSERPLESPTATIAVENVSHSFGDLPVLEDVSLTVEPGEFVGLVGPNGAGKTTLLRAISGALEPDAGTVTIDGTDIHAVSSRASSRLVAVVPQDTTLSFSFDVRDVVEMGRHPHRSRFSSPTPEDRDAVERALDRTRTDELADRSIDEVSGGQRQRVVLARAIAQATPALLLDEPTASLDINHQIETLELVRDLVGEGRTAVAAIHDLELAARYCDRLVLLADGSVSREGSPSAVLTSAALNDAFDTNAVVTPNPVTGSETVTALEAGAQTQPQTETNDEETTATSSPERVPDRVHVLGTGTAAAGVVARLDAATADIEVSLGPVSSGDAAAELARSREIDLLEVDPFSGVSDADRSTVASMLREADVTVLADFVAGAGSEPLLEWLGRLESRESRDGTAPLVVVETRPFAERNAAGDAARARYDACREQAVESSVEGVLEAAVRANAGQSGSRPRSATFDSPDA